MRQACGYSKAHLGGPYRPGGATSRRRC